MDTKHAAGADSDDDLLDDALGRLEKADPAEAPAIAEDIAGRLAGAVDLDHSSDGHSESGD